MSSKSVSVDVLEWPNVKQVNLQPGDHLEFGMPQTGSLSMAFRTDPGTRVELALVDSSKTRGTNRDAVATAELQRLLGVWCCCRSAHPFPTYELPCPIHNTRELANSIRSAIGDMNELRGKLDNAQKKIEDPLADWDTAKLISELRDRDDASDIKQAL